ncbi:GntG family PLP-dependent aldolase [Terrarubrum flagellatum]|uniref:threonine aldolase family protein n=1 Tax=Terrirubrum flagellatum TaxID=2895980 RepID=UPI0031455D03
MRRAIAEAPVGDDQYGEDPSVSALEARLSEMAGKEAGLFVPSGTMANQIALRVLARPGDELITGGEAHVLWHEAGAAAAIGSVQVTPIGTSGLFTAEQFIAACKPRDHIVFAPTGLVVIENTHNRGGGVVFPQEEAVAICAAAQQRGIPAYLDGARLFNAALASRTSVATLAAPFRMASVSLSKGLGCPVGSVLLGSKADIAAARRVRRIYGGAMRQSGMMAAAGLYALDHHIERLAEDHDNAALFADILAAAPGIKLDRRTIQTNIVIFTTTRGPAAPIVEQAREKGVLLSLFGSHMIRATTHLDVSRSECERAAQIVRDILATA